MTEHEAPIPASSVQDGGPDSPRFDAREFVKTLPARPGVYRMHGPHNELLYVGKARNLKARVASYFHARNVAPKIQALVNQVTRIEVTVTNSDSEALLLEYNLIKEHKPRFNVMLRDDKSFPWIHVTPHPDFPRLAFYRGPRNKPGRFFGPYPNAGAVRETLQQLQKLFRLRNCEDTFFENRSRPCLQHQIERCSAPCVGLISPQDYARDVDSAVKVLEGRSEEVNEELAARMEAAAAALDFETAARLRDQLAALKKVQAQQIVTAASARDVDVVALASESGEHCVAVMFVRGGRNLGSTTFFPRAPMTEPGELMSSFLSQYYFAHEVPPDIVVNTEPDDVDMLCTTLIEKLGRRVRIRRARRGLASRWVQMTETNAAQALRMRLANRGNIEMNLEAVREALQMPETPQRIECFDISHTRGEGTVASCVVFGPEGPVKSDYRRFNISGIEPGDDYGAMRQVLTRRYRRVRAGEIPPPDLVLIDGGRGQLSQALDVLEELDLPQLAVCAVAKGADRRPGQERLFTPARGEPIVLSPDSPALHLVQRVRDEAHRFAILGHRRRRARRHNESALEAIPGLGPARRRELLKQFGGLQGILRAGVDDLAQVRGIGRPLAQLIYEHLHPGA
jgi:excinuclease ABC subunit C